MFRIKTTHNPQRKSLKIANYSQFSKLKAQKSNKILKRKTSTHFNHLHETIRDHLLSKLKKKTKNDTFFTVM